MTSADPGLEMVERLAALLQVDDEWTVRRERGFTWWSYRLAQHIEAGPVDESQGMAVSTVRIRTDVVNEVTDTAMALEMVGLVNAQETMSALVFDEEARSISECCTGVVHAENLDAMQMLLGFAAVLQNKAGHSRAHPIADVTKATIAQSEHPISGERPEEDELLSVAGETVAAGQSQSSAYAGALIAALPDFANGFGFVGSGDESGFTCEVPYGEIGAGSVGQDAGQTALVRMFADQPHPEFGSGALCVLAIPVTFGDDDAARSAANTLNLIEATEATMTNLIGGWTKDPSSPVSSLAFTCFLPNTIARAGVLENMLLSFAMRSQFAAQHYA